MTFTKILLTGEPRVGKSTAIKKIINSIGIEHFGGFYTEEIRADGERTGFQIITLNGEKGKIADVNFESPLKISRYKIKLDFLEKIAIPELYNAMNLNKIIIVDEIGPMQVFSKNFKNVISELIHSNSTFLGTIFLKPYDWINEIKQNSNIKIVRLDMSNRDNVPSDICKILNVNLK